MAVHWLLYTRILAAGLRRPAPAERVGALKRWFLLALGWQVLVLVLVFAYTVPAARDHPAGFGWALPPLGAILGSALPLQVAVVRIMRALRRDL